MKKYGVIGIGSGCGALISDEDAGHIAELNERIHIHPALSVLIPTTVNSAEEG